MVAVPQKVLNWLHNVLTTEYRYVDRTYSDVAQTLAYNSAFSLRTDVYTFENGGSSLLLNLQGTLPVSFRGTQYAFPISIWIPREYPSSAPINFVTPTSDMAIRPGQYVSGEGRIYHPYLAGWRDDRSSIAEFISILQDVFAREPPVVARQEPLPRQIPMPQGSGAPPPIPPLPPELGRSGSRIGQPSPSTGQQPPPPPPKTFDSRGHRSSQTDGPPPLPPLPRTVSQHSSSQQLQPKEYARAPQPVPQHPLNYASSHSNNQTAQQHEYYSTHYSNQQQQREPTNPLGPQTGGPHDRPPASISPPHARYLQQGRSMPSANHGPHASSTSLYQDLHPQPQYHQKPQQPPLQAYQQSQFSYQQKAQPPKAKPPEDLLTSPFETALPNQPTNVAPPPIPPNPQKDALLSALSQTLTQQIQSTHASNTSAIAPLRAQQAALSSTLNAVNTEIFQLNDLEKLLSSNETILHQAMRDADTVLEDAKRREVPNIDEVLVAPTLVAGQLYEAVAEQRAIEDCRGVLGRALDKGRIGGAVWAKQTRSLAREEFLKKALIKKIARGMGLAEEDKWG